MRNFLYFVVYLLIWIYIVPHISDDLQFFFKVFLISLPVLFGYAQIEEIQEGFKAQKSETAKKTQLKKKIIGQLADLQEKSTIALVYTDGTVDFLSGENKRASKKLKNSAPKKKSDKISNWYSSL
jgi:hypothetical protein